MHDTARPIRTLRTTHPLGTALTLDVVRPSQAFGAPPAPAMQDAWHWLRRAFVTLRAVGEILMGEALRRRAGGDRPPARSGDEHPTAGVRP